MKNIAQIALVAFTLASCGKLPSTGNFANQDSGLDKNILPTITDSSISKTCKFYGKNSRECDILTENQNALKGGKDRFLHAHKEAIFLMSRLSGFSTINLITPSVYRNEILSRFDQHCSALKTVQPDFFSFRHVQSLKPCENILRKYSDLKF